MKNDDLWKAEGYVMDAVQQLIATHHPKLALVSTNIAVLMQAKATKSAPFGKASKAPKLLGPLGDGEYEFVLVIPADLWATLNNEQRTALLDRLLCGCSVEEDEETHEIKCSTKAPDVSFYYDELERHGNWMPREQEAEGPAMDIESKLKSAGTPTTTTDD